MVCKTTRGPSVSVKKRRFAGLRVFAADDNAINREVLAEALSRLGARIKAVENGVESPGWPSLKKAQVSTMT